MEKTSKKAALNETVTNAPKVYSQDEYNQVLEAYKNVFEDNKNLNNALQQISKVSICIELLKLECLEEDEEKKLKAEIFTILGFKNENE